MKSQMIEHWGMVKCIDGDRVTVVVETTSCAVCGHGGHCGIGKVPVGRQAALLNLQGTSGLKVGDFVNVGMQESRLTLAALLGYLFPALATLVGALIGIQLGGTASAIALGAAAGFVGSLVVARIAITFTSGLSPRPQLIPSSSLSATFPLE